MFPVMAVPPSTRGARGGRWRGRSGGSRRRAAPRRRQQPGVPLGLPGQGAGGAAWAAGTARTTARTASPGRTGTAGAGPSSRPGRPPGGRSRAGRRRSTQARSLATASSRPGPSSFQSRGAAAGWYPAAPSPPVVPVSRAASSATCLSRLPTAASASSWPATAVPELVAEASQRGRSGSRISRTSLAWRWSRSDSACVSPEIWSRSAVRPSGSVMPVMGQLHG